MDMPSKRRTVAAQAAARGPLPEVPGELLDQLVKGPMTPAEVQDLFLSFQNAVIERTMSAEMNLNLDYQPGEPKPDGKANERNGSSGKTLITERGPVRVELPHDRDGNFEIYVMNVADPLPGTAGSDPVRLTHTRANNYEPAWRP